jgi:excisionase family DNA binding protein
MGEPRMPELLTPGEVAQMFRVDPKTVTRWAQSGRLRSVRTIGGHRRYYKTEIEALLTNSRELGAESPREDSETYFAESV